MQHKCTAPPSASGTTLTGGTCGRTQAVSSACEVLTKTALCPLSMCHQRSRSPLPTLSPCGFAFVRRAHSRCGRKAHSILLPRAHRKANATTYWIATARPHSCGRLPEPRHETAAVQGAAGASVSHPPMQGSHLPRSWLRRSSILPRVIERVQPNHYPRAGAGTATATPCVARPRLVRRCVDVRAAGATRCARHGGSTSGWRGRTTGVGGGTNCGS